MSSEHRTGSRAAILGVGGAALVAAAIVVASPFGPSHLFPARSAVQPARLPAVPPPPLVGVGTPAAITVEVLPPPDTPAIPPQAGAAPASAHPRPKPVMGAAGDRRPNG